MSRRRTRRVRRVLIVTAVATALAGGATLVTHHRHAQREAQLQTVRRDGLAAHAAGDDATALAALERFVLAHPADADADALIAYADVRAKTESPDGKHLLVAADALEQVLARDAGVSAGQKSSARRALLELLPRTTDTAGLERVADAALLIDPADPLALRARLAATLRHGNVADMLAAAHDCARADPDDFDSRVTVLRLMDRLGRSAAEIAAYAEAQFTPGDVRRTLLRAAADAPVDPARALAAVRRCVPLAAANATLTRQAVTLFDALGQPADSLKLLDAAAQKTKDADLVRPLAVRLWQRGDTARLAAAAAPLDGNDSIVLSLRAAAFYQLQRPADARAVVARLAHNTDRASAAWTIALPAKFESAAPIAALEKAVTRLPGDAVLHAWLGDALAAAGEPVLALPHLETAATLAPSWPAPQFARAAALLAVGEGADAVAVAQTAFDRSPTLSAAVDLIAVRFAAYDRSPDAAAARDLLDAAARVQAARPGEPRTMAVRLTLLARTGRRDDAARLLAAFAEAAPADTAARRFVIDAAEREGLSTNTFSSQSPDSQVSGLACEAVLPENASQARPLTTRQKTNDSQFATIVDRLHAVAGDDGRQWRLARATSLTDSADPNAAFEAVTLLGELVHETPRQTAPRVELARALERAGNPVGAIEHLRLALANDPNAGAPLAALVGLLRRTGRDAEAADVLRHAAAAVALPTTQRMRVAELWLDGNDAAAAVATLGPADALPPAGRLMRAEALARAGDLAAAAAAFDALVTGPASPAVLAAAADFRATCGDVAGGRGLIDRLATSAATPDETRLARGRFEARHGDPAAALALLTAAADTEAGAAALIDFRLQRGQPGDAVTAAVAAASQWPGSRAIAAALDAARTQAAVAAARDAFARADGSAAVAVRPLLADAGGRRIVRGLARSEATTLAAASALLSAADAATAENAPEWSEAAAAWAVVGRRLGDRAALASATRLSETILAARPAATDVRLLHAGLLAQDGRTVEAEAELRSVLVAEPARAAANNDLACLLLDRRGDLNEAERLAAKAVTILPAEPAYRDTLDRVRQARQASPGRNATASVDSER